MAKGLELDNAYLAAYLYYERNLTQGEVARRLEVSRPTVARFLARAREEGIVSIVVREPGRRVPDLESVLVERFGLEVAVVVPGDLRVAPARDILLSRGALDLVRERSGEVGRIGLGWGRSVLAFVEAVERGGVPLRTNAEVVPLIGGLGQTNDVFQINEMVRRTALSLGASARLLHVPALVADGGLRAALMAEATVGPVVEAWKELDVVVVGVGGRIDPDYQHAFMGEHLQDEALVANAVGDVCAHYFDLEGGALGGELDGRLVAVGREELRRTPLGIGVAGGPEKVSGIVGAVRSGLINALVTDEKTATSCLGLAEAA